MAKASPTAHLDAVAALNAMTPPDREKWLKAFASMPTFSQASLRIRDKDGVLRPLVMKKSQLRLNALINRQLRDQGFVRIVAAKARQVMVSTQTAAEFWKHCVFQPGRKAMVFAHTEDASKNIFDYYSGFHKHYRQFGPFGLPPLVSDTDQKLLYANDSLVQCFTGGNPDAINSFRATCLHFSEFALMKNAAALLHNANGTLPMRPGTMFVVESSARGRGNTFHEMVQRARGGKSQWALYFFGWQDHEEYFSPLSQSIESFQKSLTPEEEAMRREYRLSFEQLNWRRLKIEEMNGNVDMFKQEFPANVDEAFLGSGRAYFIPTVVTKSFAPLVGETGRLEQDMSTGRPLVRMIPDRFGDVHIFKRPERGELYAAGCDPSKGVDPSMKAKKVSDPDYMGGHILNVRTGEQVARIRVRATPIEGARRMADLCRWYGYAFLTPEANDPGFIEGLIEDGYPEELIAQRDPTADIRSGELKSIHQLGWLTTERTRRQLIGKLESCLFDGSLIIRDELTYAEICSFVVKDDGRAEHDDGCHDDLVFGLALACDAMLRAPAIFKALNRMREREQQFNRAIPIKLFGRRPRPDHREIDDTSYMRRPQ